LIDNIISITMENLIMVSITSSFKQLKMKLQNQLFWMKP